MDTNLYHPPTTQLWRTGDLEQAFEGRDETRVWALALDLYAPNAQYDAIRAHAYNTSAPCTVRPKHGIDLKSALLLWPVIVDRRLLVANDGNKTTLSQKLTHWLAQQVQEWTNYTSELCLLQDFFGYNFVACNGPLVMREMLDQMTRNTSAASSALCIQAQHFESQVPDKAPMLYFLVAAMNRLVDWPVARDPNHYQTQELSHKLDCAMRVDLCQQQHTFGYELQIGVPEFAESAVESGLRLWLAALDQSYGFCGWSAEPQGGDRVDLWIDLDDEVTAPLRIPLRTYQLGLLGVERLLAYVDALVRKPVDMGNAFSSVALKLVPKH